MLQRYLYLFCPPGALLSSLRSDFACLYGASWRPDRQPLADAATFVCCIPLVARFFRRLPMDAPLPQGDMPSISPGK